MQLLRVQLTPACCSWFLEHLALYYSSCFSLKMRNLLPSEIHMTPLISSTPQPFGGIIYATVWIPLEFLMSTMLKQFVPTKGAKWLKYFFNEKQSYLFISPWKPLCNYFNSLQLKKLNICFCSICLILISNIFMRKIFLAYFTGSVFWFLLVLIHLNWFSRIDNIFFLFYTKQFYWKKNNNIKNANIIFFSTYRAHWLESLGRC